MKALGLGLYNARTIGLILMAMVAFLAAGRLTTDGRDSSPCSFTGTPAAQAQCLLRPVAKYGEAGQQLGALPSPLDHLIGQPTEQTTNKDLLRKYLVVHQIKEQDIGGSLSDPVSRTSDGKLATYFIIHDTSDPTLERTDSFPPENMDAATWPGNNLSRYLKGSPVAHVFINRLGESVTGHDFKIAWRSTKYESKADQRKGLFLAVESVQPRRKDSKGIDSEAPMPGFSDPQLDRLALVYVAASVRRGQWLIPAFHAVIDLGVGTHDDPQNFDLSHWAERLNLLLQSIQSRPYLGVCEQVGFLAALLIVASSASNSRTQPPNYGKYSRSKTTESKIWNR